MTRMQEAVVAAARALIGVRFRPGGRDPAYGLDCVGLAAAAFAGAGLPLRVPEGYRQRGGDPARIAAAIEAMGLRRAEGATAAPGALLLMAAGPVQLHLGIRSERGLIHADAGLRRVVERPGPIPWPMIGSWRAEEI